MSAQTVRHRETSVARKSNRPIDHCSPSSARSAIAFSVAPLPLRGTLDCWEAAALDAEPVCAASDLPRSTMYGRHQGSRAPGTHSSVLAKKIALRTVTASVTPPSRGLHCRG